MSVINQMLQDLDKRRASADERSALPVQIRILPPERRAAALPMLAVGAGILATLGAVAWGLSDRFGASVRGDQRDAGTMVMAVPLRAEPIGSDTAQARVESASPLPLVSEPPREIAPQRGASADLMPAPAKGPAAIEKKPAAPAEKKAAAPAVEKKAAAPAPATGKKTAVPEAVAEKAAAPAEARAAASAHAEAKPVAHTEAKAGAPAPEARLARADLPREAKDNVAVRASSQATEAPPAAKAGQPAIDKHSRELTPQQLAENEFRTGATLLNGGRIAEAQERFRVALQKYPGHTAARQALFGLLLNQKNAPEAERVLQDGLKLNARQPGFAMALARMQIDRGDTAAAVDTLQRSAPAAAGNADYLAFLAALLQRQERHAEAAEQYQAALALAPASGVWHMGLAISLQALGRNAEAQEAFRRAKAGNLNADLQAFVDERLSQLQRR